MSYDYLPQVWFASAFNSVMHMIRYACVLIWAACTAYARSMNTTVVPVKLQSNLTKYLQPVCCCNTLHSDVLVAACVVHRVRLCSSRLDKKHANAAVHTVAELLRCMHLRMHLTVSTNACACMYANKCTAILKHMHSVGPAMPMPSMQETKISWFTRLWSGRSRRHQASKQDLKKSSKNVSQIC